jgi:hypothetical protein
MSGADTRKKPSLDDIQHPDLPWRRSIFRTRRDPWNVLPVIVLAPDQTLKLLVDSTNATPDRKQSSIIPFAIYTSENI